MRDRVKKTSWNDITDKPDGLGGGGNLWKGAWVTSTAYAVNNIVKEANGLYVCKTAHTSGTFATDLAATKWELMLQDTGGGSQSIGNETASTIVDDAITYTNGKIWYINGDAGIDFSAKIDLTTMTDGATMDVIFYANAGSRTVSYATGFKTKLSTSMAVASGDYAHYRIVKQSSNYHLYLIGVTA